MHQKGRSSSLVVYVIVLLISYSRWFLNLLVNKHNVLGLDPCSVAVIFDLISEKNVI